MELKTTPRLSAREELKRLVKDCTVRVACKVGTGTGFFVAPGRILTCAHVVEREGAKGVAFRYRGASIDCEVSKSDPNPCPPLGGFPDIALLRFDPAEAPGHPCVLLGPEIEGGDEVFAYGFPGKRPGGDEMLGVCEGISGYGAGSDADRDERDLIKIKNTQVLPGASGSPLLNLRTGRICGMIKKSRDPDTDIGGLAVQVSVILETAPGLEDEQQQCHAADRRWGDSLARYFAPAMPARPRPNMAPKPPSFAVERTDEYKRLKRWILDSASSGALGVSAVEGMGGVGKTTLALQAAADAEVAAGFPDGVLWASLGPESTPLDGVGSWIQVIEGRKITTTSIDAASSELRPLLDNRRFLLLVDNVWSKRDVEPFLPPSNSSRLIFTTRRQQIAAELGVPALQLDVMEEELAIKVVENRLGRALISPEREEAAEVIRLVGGMPIALPMVSERIAKGKTWRQLKKVLSAEIDRLTALEPAGGIGTAEPRIEACFRISADALMKASRELHRSFCRLGLLPAGLSFTGPLAATTLGVDSETASNILEFIWNEALLTRSIVENSEEPRYRMHDLVHAYAAKQLSGNSAARLAKQHADLLARYRKQAKGGWHTLPNDGYIHDYLLWHMARAAKPAEIHKALSETAGGGANGWFQAREAQGHVDGYLRDLHTAAGLVQSGNESLIAAGTTPLDMEGELRYALCRSSVFSRDADYPPKILEALVRSGVWTIRQAVDKAARYADSALRAQALVLLARAAGDPGVAAGLLAQAASSAAMLGNDDDGIRVKENVAAALLEAGMPQAAVDLLRGETPLVRVFAAGRLLTRAFGEASLLALRGLVVDVSPRLRLDFLAQASAHAVGAAKDEIAAEARRLMEDSEWFSSTETLQHFSLLAADSEKEQLIEKALDGLRVIRNQEKLSEILKYLAPYMGAGQRDRALKMARGLYFENLRAVAEMALLAGADDETREQAVAAYLSELEHAESADLRSIQACVSLAGADPRHSGEAIGVALRLLPRLRREYDLGKALESLASVVPEAVMDEAIDAAIGIPVVEERVAALTALLSRGVEIRRSAEDLATGLTEEDRIYQTAMIASYYPEPERTRLLEYCAHNAGSAKAYYINDVRLAILGHLTDRELQAYVFDALVARVARADTWINTDALKRLAAQCPERFVPEVLDIALRCPDLQLRYDLLNRLAPRLDRPQLEHFIAGSGRIGDAGDAKRIGGAVRMDVLHLPSDLLVQLARTIKEEEHLKGHLEHQALRTICRAMAESGRPEVAVQWIPDPSFGFYSDNSYEETLREIGNLVPPDLLLGRIRDIPGVLGPLLEYLPPEQRTPLALDAWNSARKAGNFALACAVYARFLPDLERQEAVDTAITHALNSDRGWAGMAPGVCPWMTPDQLERLAARYSASDTEVLKAEGLLDLAPFRGERGFQEAFRACDPLDKPERAETAAAYMSRFEGPHRDALRHMAVSAARSLEERDMRAEGLLYVAVELPPAESADLVVEAAQAALEYKGDRRALLLALTPHVCRLPLSRRYQVFQAMLDSDSRGNRRRTLYDIEGLRYVLYTLAGAAQAHRVREVIEAVEKWWP